VDVKGTYRFYWFYEENRFGMDVPNVCGMYWQDVTDDKFEVTLGKESEVTLPTVYTTNMNFASNIFRGVDQVRLVSTDETVATIEYTISLDGLGTITLHKAGECDIYAVHDITDYYCYDSVAFHLTVLPESTPTVWTALKVGDVIKLGDKIEVPAEGDGSWGINGNVLKNAWGPYTLIRANIVQEEEWDDPVVTETEDGAYYVFKAENDDFYPLSNLGKGTGLVVTETSDGLVVTNVGDLGMPVFTVAVHDNGGAPTGVENVQGNVRATKVIEN
jgi:subtilisin family serine protease